MQGTGTWAEDIAVPRQGTARTEPEVPISS
jgi:hypothetical protein